MAEVGSASIHRDERLDVLRLSAQVNLRDGVITAYAAHNGEAEKASYTYRLLFHHKDPFRVIH